MKINAVISSDVIKKNKIPTDRLFIITFITIALALVAGAVVFCVFEDKLTAEINNSFNDFIKNVRTTPILNMFSAFLLTHIPYIALTMISGTSTIGFIMVILSGFFKAMGLGIVSSYLYSVYELKGIEYALLVFFPGKFFLLLSMFLIIYFSLRNSFNIKNTIIGQSTAEKNETLFTLRIFTVMLIYILSAAIECFFVVNFSSLFSF